MLSNVLGLLKGSGARRWCINLLKDWAFTSLSPHHNSWDVVCLVCPATSSLLPASFKLACPFLLFPSSWSVKNVKGCCSQPSCWSFWPFFLHLQGSQTELPQFLNVRMREQQPIWFEKKVELCLHSILKE